MTNLANFIDSVVAEESSPKIKKKRKAGGGRKPIYTSKSKTFTTSIPENAIPELKSFLTTLKNKHKK